MMDKQIEKKYAEMIRKKVAEILKPLGFVRTKPTFYTRSSDDRIEFVHLHKFTFCPRFRVHIGIRLLCDPFDAIALNGEDSDRFKSKYNLDFSMSEESVLQCASNIMLFVQNIGLPWFEIYKESSTLINSKSSPIDTVCKEEYKRFMIGNINWDNVNQSKRLLGVKFK